MKTALVTGGSRGIGAQIVRELAQDGARVAFLYHASDDAAQALARETGAMALKADVADRAAVQAAFAQALRALRHIDALVCNAGIAYSGLAQDTPQQVWERLLAVNVSGAFYAVQEALPGMISQGSGRIVLISSMWGQVGASMEVAYSAAKAALLGMGKALAKELGPSGITVNCLCPGVINTDVMRCYDEETKHALRDETPLGRLGTPQDVAAAVRFLLSEDAAFITGQVLGVNGGFVI